MSADLTIRAAEAADGAAVVALWRACGLVVPANDPAADFAFARAGAASDVLVGVDADGAVRASAMVGHDGHRGWLYYVSVDPGLRGRGHGRAVIRAAEAWLRARGVPKVHLLVRETNAGVVPFYAGLGYAVAPRVMMEKRLRDAP